MEHTLQMDDGVYLSPSTLDLFMKRRQTTVLFPDNEERVLFDQKLHVLKGMSDNHVVTAIDGKSLSMYFCCRCGQCGE